MTKNWIERVVRAFIKKDLKDSLEKQGPFFPKEDDIFVLKTKKGTVGYQKYMNGVWVFHRMDGPAIVMHDGKSEYYIDGEELTEERYLAKTSKLGKILYE